MKQYGRLVVLFGVVAVLLLVFYVFRKASAPESVIIATEKARAAASYDKGRLEKDPVFAAEYRDRMAFLDLQQAEACLKESKPDQAIALLQKLIADEQVRNKGQIPRRAVSYQQEARYFEVLQRAYGMKHDEAGAERAGDQRNQLMSKAEIVRKNERMSEGKSVGINGE